VYCASIASCGKMHKKTPRRIFHIAYIQRAKSARIRVLMKLAWPAGAVFIPVTI